MLTHPSFVYIHKLDLLGRYMDQQFYNKYRTGDLMAHATNDLNAIKFVAGGGIITLTDSISITIVTLFSMFFIIDWQLTLLTIIPFPLLIFVSRYLGKMMNETFRGSLKAFSSMNDRVQESVAGMQVIKGFGEEEDDYRDFTEATDNVVESNRKVNLINSAYTPTIEMITGLTSFWCLLYIARANFYRGFNGILFLFREFDMASISGRAFDEYDGAWKCGV